MSKNKNLDTKQISAIFNALSNETRLEIFKLLVDNHNTGLRPGEISNILKIPKNTLSFHLSLLTNIGLVNAVKTGREIYLKPMCNVITDITDYLLQNCCVTNNFEKEGYINE